MNPDQVIATLNGGPDSKAVHGADDHKGRGALQC